MDHYLPIAEHGLIGDLHTAALVGVDGTIDWYCCPDFDSPSVFAAILDRSRGGFWRIAPTGGGWTSKQLYFPDTNILITRFLSADGVGEVQDFMPIASARDHPPHSLIRRVVCVRGGVEFEAEFEPRFDYGRARHEPRLHERGVIFDSPALTLALSSPRPLQLTESGARAAFTLSHGQTATFALVPSERGEEPPPFDEQTAGLAFNDAIRYWRGWLSHSRYTGRWREMVHRSALTLKLLTYKPTGAIVAAPTTSLPQQLSRERNWDYRYTWIRDAAFSLYALLRLGFTSEARAFMQWLEGRCHEREQDGGLQIMYGIHGEHQLEELTLDHLNGYRGCKPVRIGNGAFQQLQLDIY